MAAAGQNTPGGGKQAIVRTGDALDRFVLGEVLGHGGMATVFRSRDPNLDREVAIKVLSPAISAQRDGAERFRREALAVARVRHRGIVEVHDFVAANQDHPAYLVEELIEGPTLQEILDRHGRGLLPEAAAVLVAEVAEALQAGHAEGVIHRDIKPANVMLEDRGDGARVVVADFGVAHIGALATMTATGAILGSPAYMSPEQARGMDVDASCDVWALGVLLYQLSTGHLPFAARDPITALASITRGTFQRASQIDPRVGPELDRLISQCLTVDPARRVNSAGTLAKALRDLAQEASLPTASVIIRQVLADPAQLEVQLCDPLATHAIAAARRNIKAGHLARALAELGRATAHRPLDPEAERLLGRISARRRTGRIAVWGALGGALLAGLWFVARPVGTDASLIPTDHGSETGATVTSKPPVTKAAPTSPELDEPAAVEPAPAEGAQEVAPIVRERPKAAHTQPRAAASPTTELAATIAIAEDSKKPATGSANHAPAAEAAPGAPAPRPLAPAHLRLLAQRAFCFPSLDGGPTRPTPADYADVAPGQHVVHCARSLGGTPERVGIIDVPAGARIERNIQPGPDGKPMFSKLRNP